jgi:hypothetical protein
MESTMKFIVQVGPVDGEYETVYETSDVTTLDEINAFAIYLNPRNVGAGYGMGMKKRLLSVGPDGETELAYEFIRGPRSKM